MAGHALTLSRQPFNILPLSVDRDREMHGLGVLINLIRSRAKYITPSNDVTLAMVMSSLQLEALSSSRNAQEDLRNLDRCQLYIINELERVYYQSRKVVIRSKSVSAPLLI